MGKSFADEFHKTYESAALPWELTGRFDIVEVLAQNAFGDTYLLSERDADIVIKRAKELGDELSKKFI